MRRILILLALLAVAAGDQQQKLRELAKIPTVHLTFRVEFLDAEKFLIQSGLRATNRTPARPEAELLAATKTATNATLWIELGDRYFCDMWRLSGDIQTNELPLATWGAITNRLVQAMGCYTKAIEAAPREPAVYLHRAACLMFAGPVIARGKDVPEEVLARLALNPTVIADVCQAARLRPDDLDLQVGAISMHLWGVAVQTGKKPEIPNRKILTPATKLAIAPFRERLDALAKHADPKIAAGACERLAFLEMTLDDNDAMPEALLERAIRLNPAASEQAWDMLIGLPLTRGDYSKLVELCTVRLKTADTSRNRLLLAKAQWANKQFDACAEQLQLVLKQEPKHFLATAGLAALALRQGDDAKAAELLTVAGKLITPEITAEQQADFHVLEAIHAAITGHQREAFGLLAKARRVHPENKRAQEVSDALLDF